MRQQGGLRFATRLRRFERPCDTRDASVDFERYFGSSLPAAASEDGDGVARRCERATSRVLHAPIGRMEAPCRPDGGGVPSAASPRRSEAALPLAATRRPPAVTLAVDLRGVRPGEKNGEGRSFADQATMFWQ